MSQLTLRDIASNEEIVVPPEGFVFGRAGGDADIQLDDNTISRRQARVSSRQGMWVLEVMVVPPGQRIPRPQALQEGQTFFIGQSEFEVVVIEDEAPPPPKAVPRKSAPVAPAAAKAAPKKELPASKTVQSQPVQKRAAPPRQAAPDEDEEAPDDRGADDAEGGGGGGVQGIKALFVGVPKGIAYYLVNVPKLLVNPMGTVKRAIDELPAEPMGPTGLIGYGLPAMLATTLLGSIAAGIAMLIGGGGFAFSLFFPIVSIIIGVVVAVVVGFIYHPVVAWLVKILKGESDQRSRSNYFLQMQTVSIVIAVPNAIGAILSAVHPLAGMVGLLLGLVASLASLYVVYQWWINCFKVVNWVRYVILVLGALTVLSSVYGLVMGAVATVRGFGSGGSVVVGSVSGDAEQAMKEAEKLRKEAYANADSATKEAMAAAEKAAKDGAARAAKATAAATAAAAAAAAAAKEPAEAPKAAEEAPVAAARPSPADEPSEELPAKEEAPGAYAVFARKLEGVEKKLEADPTLLRNKDIQTLYGEFLDVASKADREFEKDRGRDSKREKLFRLKRNDRLFREARPTVEKLAGKLGVN
jgi:hypothetical protein